MCSNVIKQYNSLDMIKKVDYASFAFVDAIATFRFSLYGNFLFRPNVQV